jgi:hypothetical protein
MSTHIESVILEEPQDIKVPTNTDNTETQKKPGTWKPYEKISFRIGFLYMLILCIPTYSKFYKHLFRIF